MNQIRLEVFANLRSLHFWQVARERNLIVQRKRKAKCMLNAIAKHFLGQLLGGGFAVDRNDFHLVSCFLHEFQHFFETIGISTDMSEWSRFYHETNFARRVPT